MNPPFQVLLQVQEIEVDLLYVIITFREEGLDAGDEIGLIVQSFYYKAVD